MNDDAELREQIREAIASRQRLLADMRATADRLPPEPTTEQMVAYLADSNLSLQEASMVNFKLIVDLAGHVLGRFDQPG
jgi:hypothetical protein